MATEQQREIFKLVRENPDAVIRIKPPQGQKSTSSLKLNTIYVDIGLDQYVFTGESKKAYEVAKNIQKQNDKGKTNYQKKVRVIKNYINVSSYKTELFLNLVPFSEEELKSKSRKNTNGLMDYKKVYAVWLLSQKRATLMSVGRQLGIDHATVIHRVNEVYTAIEGFYPQVKDILDSLSSAIKNEGYTPLEDKLTQTDMEEFLSVYYSKHKVNELIDKIKPHFGWTNL